MQDHIAGPDLQLLKEVLRTASTGEPEEAIPTGLIYNHVRAVVSLDGPVQGSLVVPPK